MPSMHSTTELSSPPETAQVSLRVTSTYLALMDKFPTAEPGP